MFGLVIAKTFLFQFVNRYACACACACMYVCVCLDAMNFDFDLVSFGLVSCRFVCSRLLLKSCFINLFGGLTLV